MTAEVILFTYEVRVGIKHSPTAETHTVQASDDLAALSAALPFCKQQRVEIWRDGQCTAKLKNGALPLDLIWAGVG